MKGNRFIRNVLCILFTCVIHFGIVLDGFAQTTYYVDGVGNGDTLATLPEVNALTLDPGDSILFKRGVTWKGNNCVIVTNSGTEENPIYFGAYGTGPRPKFDRNKEGPTGGFSFGSYSGTTAIPIGYIILEDVEVAGGREHGVACIDGAHHFVIRNVYSHHNGGMGIFLMPDNLYYWVQAGFSLIEDCVADSNDGHGFKICGRQNVIKNCIGSNNDPNAGPLYGAGLQVPVESWESTVIGGSYFNNQGSGVRCVSKDSNNSITGVVSYGNFIDGILITENAENVTVSNCTTYYNNANGINVNNVAESILITDCVSYSNTKEGIGVFADPGLVTIKNSRIYSNGRYGVAVYFKSKNTDIVYNLIYDNTLYGLYIDTDDNVEILNNVLYGNNLSGVYGVEAFISGKVADTQLKNNILRNVQIKNNTISNNNLYYGESPVIRLISTSRTLEEYRNDTGNDVHSIRGNPLFIDPSNNNFKLQKNSPAVNAGTFVGLVEDIEGNIVSHGLIPDIGANEYQNPPGVPFIFSVEISPNSGFVKVGDSVAITVTAGNIESGLTPSDVTINGNQVSLTDQGDGTYTGVYTVSEGDSDAINIEAKDVTLTGWGGTSAPKSSIGSTLAVDGNTPTITSVIISPNSGTVTTGDNVVITVTAGDNETGLTDSNVLINGKSIPLADNGDGTYTGIYTIQANDNQGVNIEAMNIILTDAAGNVSEPASSTGSTLMINTLGSIESVTLNPNTGVIKPGDIVTITATAAHNVTGLAASNATFLGKSVPLYDQDDGTYTGTYTIEASDYVEEFASNGLFSDNFEEGNTSKWTMVSSDITVSNVAKLGGYSVAYDIQEVVYKVLYKNFSISHDTTYTSFYFKIDNNFVMSDGNDNEIVKMYTTSAASAVTWHFKLRRSGSNYQIKACRDGGVEFGNWVTLNKGQWYWIKIKVESTLDGSHEWWLDGISQATHYGDKSSFPSVRFEGIHLANLDAGTNGLLYWDHFQVTTTDHNEPRIAEATVITLIDSAGNVSEPASSSGSTLTIDTSPPAEPAPTITSVTIGPNSGYVSVGDSVAITVTAGGNEAGLTASDATINGKQVALTDKGDGTYAGVYEVTEGDNDGGNIEAVNITLTGQGGASGPASSTGSTLNIDAHTPVISSVTIDPDSGWVTTGDTINITVTASNSEVGLTPSNAQINGKSIPLAGQGDGTYTGTYTVQEADFQGVNIEAANITLTDGAGNVSDPASSSGSTLSVDTTLPAPPPGAPIVASVFISPNSGRVMVGDSVLITATAENNETGLTPSDATINGKQVSLTDRGDGTYAGVYTVTEGDNDGGNIEATNITFTGEGGTSDPAFSIGSTLNVDAHTPVISSVTIGPNSGWVKASDNVTIIVTALNNEAGLTPSNSSINGQSVALTDHGDGTYTGTYTIQVGDNQGENIEATGITLTDDAGNVSSAGASSGSELNVDTQAPTITSVTINPSSDTVRTGNNVDITVTAGGNEAGLTASNAQINGRSIPLAGQGDGTYTGTYTVQAGDNQGTNIEATNITMTDAAGNVSEPASSSGSTLSVDTTPPAPPPGAPIVASVFISPNSGSVMVGDSVLITATAGDNKAGLTPSDATINVKQVSLTDRGDGTYAGVYIVTEGDNDGGNIEATNITFTGEGGTSDPASSIGSTLNVDAHTPIISSVTISPDSGWVTAGDSVFITVTASNSETGLTPSNASINVQSISLTGKGDGTYTGTYIVQAADAQSANIEAAGITLTDAAGNVSTAGASSGSSLKVDTQAPVITSVTINPSAGFVTAGNNVFITVTAGGNEAGLTASNAQINGKSITLADQGDGTYTGIYAVQAADSQAVNIEAVNVTLTDAAGNISNAASSSGSILNVDTKAPGIASVTLSPNSGWLKSGDNVTITVAALNNEYGLTPSNALINGRSVSLADQGDGIYSGTYTLQAADAQGVNIEATNITLADAAGNVSSASSSSGSTLKVDTQTPGITSVTINPNSGWLKAGDNVTITVAAMNNESGLTPSTASINGKSISLTDQGNGTYTGTYTVQAADAQGVNIEAAGITLTDAAGNVSDAGASSASTLNVDTQAPTIVSAAINPSTGTVTTGNNVVITVTAGNNEAGLTASNSQINGKSITLVDQGNGTYTGTYTVQAGDAQGANIEATNITMTDAAGNVSEPASSTGSNLSVDTTPPPPPVEAPTIASVTISPNSGYVKVGDTVTITVIAGNNETGLTPSDAAINGKQVSLADQGDGTYVGDYTVAEGDNEGSNVEATNITLTSAGGTSAPTSSSGSTLKIDAHTPTIASVMISPNSGMVTIGDTVAVLVTAGGNEAGLTASNAEINENSIPLSDLSNGLYGGLYIVQSSDAQSENIAATGITLTDPAGNVSNPASATSSLSVLTQPPEPTPEPTVAFVDEDLDQKDPFIERNPDSSWVADNDDSLTFIWNSWEAQGAVEYQVNVYSDSAAFENIEFTVTITDTSFTFKGEPGKIYCVEVIPMTVYDDPLATLRSQAILCTAETPGVPGKPIHVIKKE